MLSATLNFNILSECACDLRKSMLYDQAVRTFDSIRTKGWLQKFWAFLNSRSSRILELDAIKTTTCCIRSKRYEGLKTVEIQQIRGTENRGNDFDIHFNPVRKSDKERWVNVAMAILEECGLPPVELIKVEDTYFVRDGHHRISAAKAFGQQEIEAVVTRWELDV